MKVDKCEKCRNWAFDCELSGTSRKACMSQNYRFFKPKALGYSQRRQMNNKKAEVDKK